MTSNAANPLRLRTLISRPLGRTVAVAVVLLAVAALAYGLWKPGADVADGRYDLGHNAIWLQHGWIGDDGWFKDNDREDRKPFFRDPGNLKALAAQLRARHITDVYPHLCPVQPLGTIMPVDDRQTEAFLDAFNGFRVIPWIGGGIDDSVMPSNKKRRAVIVQSIGSLMRNHPRLAGVQLNVEPWPSGNRDMLDLLDEVRKVLPPGKILSVAAYPPPTVFHRFPEVHWTQAQYLDVGRRVDQMAVMMYDTSVTSSKIYQSIMSDWTRQILDWTASLPDGKRPEILLGIPTYDDPGVAYHDGRVENMQNGLRGIDAGLNSFKEVPAHYRGVAIYCEWKTQPSDWRYWQTHFMRH